MSEEEERAEFERIMSAVNWDLVPKCDNDKRHGAAKGRLFCQVCQEGGSFCGRCMGMNIVLIAEGVAAGGTPTCPVCGSTDLGIEVIDAEEEVGPQTPMYEETKNNTGIDPEGK